MTTDTTICLHDPLLEYTLPNLQRLTFSDGRRFGISCTSSVLYPDWVNAQKCPKVVLYREVSEINRSLRELGLVELIESRHLVRLSNIKGALLVPYEQLFTQTGARAIAKFLKVPFDAARHDVLMQMRIEPHWKRLNVGRQAVIDLIQRIKESR